MIDYTHFKTKLEEEKAKLESELSEIGERNPNNPVDWEAKTGEKDSSQADENVVADAVEEYEGNVAIVNTLETKYLEVVNALKKMEEGKYGLCEVCGAEIDADRLEANPSARTCREHMK